MSSKKTQASKTAPAAPAATPTPIKLPEAPAPVFAAVKTATRKKGVIKVPAVPEAVIADALASFEASQIEQIAATMPEPAPSAAPAATPIAAPIAAPEVLAEEPEPAANPAPTPDLALDMVLTPKTPPKIKKTKATAMNEPRSLGCLDAAAIVLAEANVAMNCKVLTGDVLMRGLWKTLGRTPEATLYAAIIREIAAKGETSRFIKTDRGLFAINPAIAPRYTTA